MTTTETDRRRRLPTVSEMLAAGTIGDGSGIEGIGALQIAVLSRLRAGSAELSAPELGELLCRAASTVRVSLLGRDGDGGGLMARGFVASAGLGARGTRYRITQDGRDFLARVTGRRA